MKKCGARKPSSGASKAVAGVRPRVRELLERSPAYRSLPADKRRQVAHDTVRVASYLVDPDRLISQEFASPLLKPNDLLTAVNFPSFVSSLINGVFGAIVNASALQMEAYAKLVAHAASSVADFAADNITDSMAREALVTRFPHFFCKSSKGDLQHTAGMSSGRSSLANPALLGLRRPWPVLDSADGIRVLVKAVRRRIARERQQSLTLVIAMGINRIVVTGGRITTRRACQAT